MMNARSITGETSLAANYRVSIILWLIFFCENFIILFFAFFDFLSYIAFAILFSFYSNHVPAKNPRVSQFESTCGLLWIQ